MPLKNQILYFLAISKFSRLLVIYFCRNVTKILKLVPNNKAFDINYID